MPGVHIASAQVPLTSHDGSNAGADVLRVLVPAPWHAPLGLLSQEASWTRAMRARRYGPCVTTQAKRRPAPTAGKSLADFGSALARAAFLSRNFSCTPPQRGTRQSHLPQSSRIRRKVEELESHVMQVGHAKLLYRNISLDLWFHPNLDISIDLLLLERVSGGASYQSA